MTIEDLYQMAKEHDALDFVVVLSHDTGSMAVSAMEVYFDYANKEVEIY